MLKLNKNIINKINSYKFFPKDKFELIEIIQNEISKNGFECNLNHINVSNITDMSFLFSFYQLDKFNGDISDWDVSSVEDMGDMFNGSSFDGDLSKWNVSNVENMGNMFRGSRFTGKNGSINNWNISKVMNMNYMFTDSMFNSNIAKWIIPYFCSFISIFQRCNINPDYKPKYEFEFKF